MATLNNEGQWIILMAFIVCVALFFLAVVVNESTIVGRTTAESVLDFTKSDIQDLRDQVFELKGRGISAGEFNNSSMDMSAIAISRQNAIVLVSDNTAGITNIEYNNGVTEYNATLYF